MPGRATGGPWPCPCRACCGRVTSLFRVAVPACASATSVSSRLLQTSRFGAVRWGLDGVSPSLIGRPRGDALGVFSGHLHLLRRSDSVRAAGLSGRGKEEAVPRDGSNTCGLSRGGLDRFVVGRRSQSWSIQRPRHPEEEEGKEVARWLGDLGPQPCRKSLGQKAPKGSLSVAAS